MEGPRHFSLCKGRRDKAALNKWRLATEEQSERYGGGKHSFFLSPGVMVSNRS